VALAAMTERLPVAAAVPLAAPFVGYALLELDGQPLRRIAPRIVLGALRARRERSADASLWYEPPGAEALHGGIMHQIRGALHHLAEGR